MAEESSQDNASVGGQPDLAAWLAGIGGALAAMYAATYPPLWSHGTAPPIDARLVVYPALFAVYFAAVWLVWRHRDRAAMRAVTVVVLASAAAFRGIVLDGRVAGNPDNWRYLWEGKVLLAGMNPYAAPPASPRYNALRRRLDLAHDSLSHQLPEQLNGVRSVYGPVATGIFAIPHLLPVDRIWSLRAIMTAFDLGTVLVLMGLLRSLGRAPALALIYAWNPMCLCGFADRAQIDAPMVFFIALAAWLICARRPTWSGIALGAALLVKVSPLLLALPFIRVGRARFALPLAALAALGLAPFVLAGGGSLAGFQAFGRYWHNMDSIHALVVAALLPFRSVIDVAMAARFIVVLAAAGYAVWRTFRGAVADAAWLLDTCACISGAAILLSPVVHPWYTASMLIFLCFAPNPGLLLLTCASMAWFLRFWVPAPGSVWARLLHAFGQHREPWRWIAYPPVYAVLIRTWLRARRRGGSPDGARGGPPSPTAPPDRSGASRTG
jgi:hypothetical protein